MMKSHWINWKNVCVYIAFWMQPSGFSITWEKCLIHECFSFCNSCFSFSVFIQISIRAISRPTKNIYDMLQCTIVTKNEITNKNCEVTHHPVSLGITCITANSFYTRIYSAYRHISSRISAEVAWSHTGRRLTDQSHRNMKSSITRQRFLSASVIIIHRTQPCSAVI
jgi:hypothetical protein